MGHKALFLDLDNTVRTTKGGKVCPNHPHEQEVLPGRYDKIWEYKNKGYKIVAVSNQGGIGLGYMTEAKCKEIMKDLDDRLGNPFDKLLYAKAAPRENHPWTKPNPGMILDASKELNIDLKSSIMVGDRQSDKDAAHNAGVKFHWADDFFKKGK